MGNCGFFLSLLFKAGKLSTLCLRHFTDVGVLKFWNWDVKTESLVSVMLVLSDVVKVTSYR